MLFTQNLLYYMMDLYHFANLFKIINKSYTLPKFFYLLPKVCPLLGKLKL